MIYVYVYMFILNICVSVYINFYPLIYLSFATGITIYNWEIACLEIKRARYP